MPDLNGTIDVVLGFVTIVLVLSLIIQSVQGVIKQLLRMKSRQAEHSLRLLFDYALTNDSTRKKFASPFVENVARMLPGGGKEGDKDGVGGVLVEEVKRQVSMMGRKSFFGTALLDVITKEDLGKILMSLDVDKLDQKTKDAINGKLGEIETWYDTVMPGLTERYERGMRWMAVLISAIVVVLFNADAIRIYRYVASDTAVQRQLLEYGQKYVNEKSAESRDDGAAETDAESKPATAGVSSFAGNSNASQNSNTANSNSSAQSNTARNSNTPANSNTAATTATGTGTEAERNEALEKLKADIAETQTLYSHYRQFGLKPFNWADSFANYETGWRTLLGWLVMTLLLSLGAPFWEDALGALFGLKNTLRSKAKTEEKKAQQPG
jgi:hypothetical protein